MDCGSQKETLDCGSQKDTLDCGSQKDASNKPITFSALVRRRQSVEQAVKQFKGSKMESKKDGKGTANDKIVEAFVKSEMKKNSSFNDLARVDSGTRRNGVGGGGVSPETGCSETELMLKNPKKLTVFEGMLTDDLPPLNSKIVRIFTSSTFTGELLFPILLCNNLDIIEFAHCLELRSIYSF